MKKIIGIIFISTAFLCAGRPGGDAELYGAEEGAEHDQIEQHQDAVAAELHHEHKGKGPNDTATEAESLTAAKKLPKQAGDAPSVPSRNTNEASVFQRTAGSHADDNLVDILQTGETEEIKRPKLSSFSSFMDRFVKTNYNFRLSVIQELAKAHIVEPTPSAESLRKDLVSTDSATRERAKKDIDRLYKFYNDKKSIFRQMNRVNKEYKRVLLRINSMNKSSSFIEFQCSGDKIKIVSDKAIGSFDEKDSQVLLDVFGLKEGDSFKPNAADLKSFFAGDITVGVLKRRTQTREAIAAIVKEFPLVEKSISKNEDVFKDEKFWKLCDVIKKSFDAGDQDLTRDVLLKIKEALSRSTSDKSKNEFAEKIYEILDGKFAKPESDNSGFYGIGDVLG